MTEKGQKLPTMRPHERRSPAFNRYMEDLVGTDRIVSVYLPFTDENQHWCKMKVLVSKVFEAGALGGEVKAASPTPGGGWRARCAARLTGATVPPLAHGMIVTIPISVADGLVARGLFPTYRVQIPAVNVEGVFNTLRPMSIRSVSDTLEFALALKGQAKAFRVVQRDTEGRTQELVGYTDGVTNVAAAVGSDIDLASGEALCARWDLPTSDFELAVTDFLGWRRWGLGMWPWETPWERW